MKRVPVIVATNHKGGVGKTTTTRILAQGLAAMPKYNKGKPILIIDLDPQCNTSKRWQLTRPTPDGEIVPVDHPSLLDGAKPGEDCSTSICDLWMGLLDPTAENVQPIPYETSNELIHVVPAHEPAMMSLIGIPVEQRPLVGKYMAAWLQTKEIAETYSYVIIDTAPSKTVLNEAAMTAATHCYIPFTPEPQPVDGIYSIVSYLYAHQNKRPHDRPLYMLGLLPNMVRNVTLHRDEMRKLEKSPAFSEMLMGVKLKNRVAYAMTDDPRIQPGEVTGMKGSDIQIEAKRFAKYIADKVEAQWEGK